MTGTLPPFVPGDRVQMIGQPECWAMVRDVHPVLGMEIRAETDFGEVDLWVRPEGWEISPVPEVPEAVRRVKQQLNELKLTTTS